MLERMLKSFVKTGKLTIIRADGTKFAAGDITSDSDPDIVLRLKTRWTAQKRSSAPAAAAQAPPAASAATQDRQAEDRPSSSVWCRLLSVRS